MNRVKGSPVLTAEASEATYKQPCLKPELTDWGL